MKPIKSITYLLFLMAFANIAASQTLKIDTIRVVEVKASKFKRGNCQEKLKRKSPDLVMLSFFNFYQDSISVFVDNNMVFKKYVSKDTTLVSTDYSNFSYVVRLPLKENKVSINTDPAKNAPTKAAGNPVTSGIMALRKICL